MTRNFAQLAGVSLIALCASGCAMQPQTPLGADGVPHERYLVGGGIQIEFIAPEPGTAYVVEQTHQKLLVTKSLRAGEAYSFEWAQAAGSPEGLQKLKDATGIDFAKSRFGLYFVPDRYFDFHSPAPQAPEAKPH